MVVVGSNFAAVAEERAVPVATGAECVVLFRIFHRIIHLFRAIVLLAGVNQGHTSQSLAQFHGELV